MRRFTSRALPVLVFLWAMFLAGCGKVGLPFPGQVVDAETGRPIEGAFVLALWKGEVGLFDAQSICYHVETTVSDEDGRFRIPGWIGAGHFGVMNSYVSTAVYKQDYEDVFARKSSNRLVLRRFKGTSEKRFGQLVKLVGPICDSKGKTSVEKLLPLSKLIYKEAKDIAYTNTDTKTLEWMQYQLEILKLGHDKAEANRTSRWKSNSGVKNAEE